MLVGFASTPSILAGGIDISVGPLAMFINCLFVAILIPAGLGNWHLAAPIILLVAAGIGALNGILLAVVRLHPVVATTGMLFVLVGLSLTIAQNPVAAPDNWTEVFAGGIGIVPGAVMTIGVAGLIWFALRRTAFVEQPPAHRRERCLRLRFRGEHQGAILPTPSAACSPGSPASR